MNGLEIQFLEFYIFIYFLAWAYFSFVFFVLQHTKKRQLKNEIKFFKQINLELDIPLGKLIPRKIGYHDSNVYHFIADIFAFCFSLAVIIVPWSLLEGAGFKPENIILIISIGTIVFCIYVFFHLLYYYQKIRIKSTQNEIDKNIEIIKTYFQNHELIYAAKYRFKSKKGTQINGKFIIKRTDKLIDKKIKKFLARNLLNDEIISNLFVITLVHKSGLIRIWKSIAIIYDEEEIINKDKNFNYEMFFIDLMIKKIREQ